jgi:alpha-mannosidase II
VRGAVVKGSFFTYADKEDEYWSGYYTSRPFVKRLGREVEAVLHAAEMIHEYRVSSQAAAAANDNGEESLQRARLDLSIFQHHDAIT